MLMGNGGLGHPGDTSGTVPGTCPCPALSVTSTERGRRGACPPLPMALWGHFSPLCLPRALYTYEDGSDDLKLAASGGKVLVLVPCTRLRSPQRPSWPGVPVPGGCELRVPCALPGGGLLELSGHFEIQKVMYGFCSVKDPQAVLPKYVLVNWVSRGSARAPPHRGVL